jgi:hypothetical protein
MLIARALEGLLTPEEGRELETLMASRPDVRREIESLRSLREVTMGLEFKKPPEEMWARYWAGVYSRLERGIAWLLISIGGAVLLALGTYRVLEVLLEDTTLPLVMKLGIVALVLGGAILLVSVVREKWFLRKTDKYREVVR